MIGLRIENLRKSYSTRRLFRMPSMVKALDGVNLSVEPGELVALVGPNGAGKTTLLEILAQLVEPDAGTVWIGGESLHESARLRSKVGYVIAEERSFFLRLSVQSNLRFFAELEQVPNPARRIDEVAEWLGLQTHLGRAFSKLSAGQKQRVSIARGLLKDPPILLFDEATRSLDPGRARRFQRLVRSLLVEQQNKTVLYATHVLEEASTLADRVALIAHGKLQALGPYASISSKVEQVFDEEAVAEDRALEKLLCPP